MYLLKARGYLYLCGIPTLISCHGGLSPWRSLIWGWTPSDLRAKVGTNIIPPRDRKDPFGTSVHDAQRISPLATNRNGFAVSAVWRKTVGKTHEYSSREESNRRGFPNRRDKNGSITVDQLSVQRCWLRVRHDPFKAHPPNAVKRPSMFSLAGDFDRNLVGHPKEEAMIRRQMIEHADSGTSCVQSLNSGPRRAPYSMNPAPQLSSCEFSRGAGGRDGGGLLRVSALYFAFI